MAFAFTYENTPALHRDVVAAISKHARVTRRLWLVVFAVPVLMSITKAIDPANRETVGRYLSVIAPWWVIYPLLFFAFLKWSATRTAKRTLANDATHQGTQHRSLDDAGLHLRNAVMSADVAWSAIQSAVETPRFFLLFQNPSCGYALPKEALTNGLPHEVRSLVAAKLATRARLQSD